MTAFSIAQWVCAIGAALTFGFALDAFRIIIGLLLCVIGLCFLRKSVQRHFGPGVCFPYRISMGHLALGLVITTVALMLMMTKVFP